jgi:hypothetical protein
MLPMRNLADVRKVIRMTVKNDRKGVISMSQPTRAGRNSHRRLVTALADAWADISYAQRRQAELNRPWARSRRNANPH